VRHGRALKTVFIAALTLTLFGSGAAAVLGKKARPRARKAVATPARSVSVTCRSPSLGGTLPAHVDLPAGYSAHASRRYPVVYFLHGLPAGPDSYQQYAFIAGALSNAGQRAIVVTPQGARDSDSDREYLDWDATEDWPAAISHDLTGCIDHRFDTIATRYGRTLVGLSAGGYGAFNIGLRNLQTFAAVESWSGYFAATNPSGTRVLNLGSAQANSAATVPRGTQLRRELKSWPSLIAFYVGRQDARFATINEQFDASLTRSGIAHTFAIYQGGHSTSLWSAHAPQWLTMALGYLGPGRGRRGAG
jgi:enterochelin esterase-like enzyme